MDNSLSAKNVIWSIPQKIAFRFFFIYLSLFILFKNNGAYPFFEEVSKLFNNVLYRFIPWFGKNILDITYKISPGRGGSGDTTYHYILLLVILIIAVLTTIIWSFLDKKRANYLKMYYWLTLAIRLYVGLMLINYGLVKVIKLQFSYPTMNVLTQTFGESSPMRLAWTFLGFSKGYNLFMGIAEIAAGLLLFRKTLTFGLIITLMVTANVMAVNYFYDVPVKILSTHLFLMTAFLFARDFKIIWQFFFFRKPVSLINIYKPNFKKGFNLFLHIVRILLLAYTLGYGTYNTLERKEMYRGEATKSILKGIYQANELTINGEKTNFDLKYDLTGWKYLMIDRKNFALIRMRDNRRDGFRIKIDSISKKIAFKHYRDSLKTYNFKYIEKENSDFYLKGIVKKDTISIKFKRTKDYHKEFLLTNRGFHWINEFPYNR